MRRLPDFSSITDRQSHCADERVEMHADNRMIGFGMLVQPQGHFSELVIVTSQDADVDFEKVDYLKSAHVEYVVVFHSLNPGGSVNFRVSCGQELEADDGE